MNSTKENELEKDDWGGGGNFVLALMTLWDKGVIDMKITIAPLLSIMHHIAVDGIQFEKE